MFYATDDLGNSRDVSPRKYVLVDPRVRRGLALLDHAVDQGNSVPGKEAGDLVEERPLFVLSDVLEHANRDDLVVARR
jgi:hypothetical protein